MFRLRFATVVACTFVCLSAHADDVPTYAFGAGVEHMPGYAGAGGHRNQAVPYVDIDLPDIGEISTTDGLQLDLIHNSPWHGGVYGNYLRGRTRDDLGRLGGKVDTLSPRIHTGGYLEYQAATSLVLGAHVSHDTQGAGVYSAVYTTWQLPDAGYIQHSLQWQWNGMNGAAMRRTFGVTPDQAQAIGTEAWQPSAGSEETTVEYDAFVPTSQHTGFAVALQAGRLLGDAARSPLVTRYGSRTQLTPSLAFLVHF
jgi:outer membrane scaffolding protein for murein synthesis (MipA/OmpV family)